MSTIQQLCPSCKRTLELPASAAGRLAKCPACEAVFTASAELGEVASPPEGPSPSEPSEPPAPKPSVNPFSQPLGSGTSGGLGTGEGADAFDTPANPYQPSHAATPVAEFGELRIVPCAIEDIFSPTLSIFARRWGVLLLAFLIALLTSFAFLVAPILVISAIADSGRQAVAGIGLLVFVPLAILFSCYLAVGLVRNAIAVARNTPSPLMEMFPPLGLVVRFLVGAVTITVVVGVAGIVFVGIVAALRSLGGNAGVAGVVAALGVLVGFGLATVAYWAIWAWVFIVSDGKGTAFGAIKAAYTISLHNKVTSILLIIIATVLSTAGTSLCYVGLLVTQPLTNLLFAVAYLRTTNQPIDDARSVPPPQQNPPLPPTRPTF